MTRRDQVIEMAQEILASSHGAGSDYDLWLERYKVAALAFVASLQDKAEAALAAKVLRFDLCGLSI